MTVRNFVLVRDNEISFSVRIQQGNGFHNQLPFTELFTPWGMVIPMSTDSFAIIDYLETGEWPWVSGVSGIVGVLLTHDGKLYEFGVDGDLVIRRRLLYGHGGWWARSMNFLVEEAVRTSVMLGGSTADIIARVENEQVVVPGGMVTMQIAILQQMLKEKFPEPLPLPTKEQRKPLEESKTV